MIYHYTTVSIQTLNKHDGELLPSEYLLTLFTRTPGGQKRIVIQCESIITDLS